MKYTFLADAQDLEIPKNTPEIQGQFDAAFSNATLHWCKRDPLGVLTSVRKVLKPGGRFTVEMGGFLNCIGKTLPSTVDSFLSDDPTTGIRSALHDIVKLKGHNPEDYDPWYFPSTEEYAKVKRWCFKCLRQSILTDKLISCWPGPALKPSIFRCRPELRLCRRGSMTGWIYLCATPSYRNLRMKRQTRLWERLRPSVVEIVRIAMGIGRWSTQDWECLLF